MPHSAAFFDLDRTLLSEGSGRAIVDALVEVGLAKSESGFTAALSDAALTSYNALGESVPAVGLALRGTRRFKGWPVDTVRSAAALIAEALEPQIEPYARQSIDDHRQAGRLLVMATASPMDLVQPLAERLGFDDLLATRQRVVEDQDRGPVYTGEIDGEFVWGRGKARSVAVWALAHGVELADSYAYSDSFFDLPMLKRVGHPVAVNPDPRLLAYATYRRWPRRWFSAPPGVPKPLGHEPQDVAGTLAKHHLLPWVTVEAEGLDHLPDSGGALLVYDGQSRFDPYALVLAAQRAGRPLRVVDNQQNGDQGSWASRLAQAFGIIAAPGTDMAIDTVERSLRAGELVAVSALDSTIESANDLGLPVIEAQIAGAEAVWPTGARFPYVMNIADPPTVQVAFSTGL